MVDAAATPGNADAVDDDPRFDEWLRLDPGATIRIVRILTTWIWTVLYRLRAYGVENVPDAGAFLLVANHSSYTDPFLQVKAQSRLVRFMAKSTLFGIWPIGFIVRNGGAFPVRRGEGDTFAMELARRMLADGQPVLVYPEGTRYRSSLPLGSPRRGTARLAMESGVPVLPVATWGVKHRSLYGRPRWRRPRATTIYGPLIHVERLDATPDNAERVTRIIWDEVQRLYDLARELDQLPRRPRTFEVPPRPAGELARD